MYVLNKEQIRAVEDSAYKNGLSYDEMMENAGVNAAKIINKRYGKKYFTVVCGKGKNGGDGFVVARKLAEIMWHDVTVILALGESTAPLALSKFKAMDGVEVLDATEDLDACLENIDGSDVIIDAVFGIGFAGSVGGDLKKLFRHINESYAAKVALDIPSGLDSGANTVPETFIKAELTLSMYAFKPVHILKPVSDLCGETIVVDTGIPSDNSNPNVSFGETIPLIPNLYEVATLNEVKNKLLPRKYDAHKGDFGHVLIVAGSYNMPGAAVLAANAAVECGAGLVTAAFPESAYPAIASKLTEPLLLPLPENAEGRISAEAIKKLKPALEKADTVLMGCGMGLDEDTAKTTEFVIKNANGTLIIDADGINCAALNINILKEAKAGLILTPHPGEMARLTGLSIGEINGNRLYAAKDLAEKYGITLLLKGANTVIAGENRIFVNPTGNPGLSRGGSGDLLAGIIAAFAANGLPPTEAAASAAFIHGLAADRVAGRHSQLACTPSRILNEIHNLCNN
ncbi:MAG: NAD(P)H-hydrate dehydratase [Oscillospiraceae bacterium]|nr:NAD(P)H-hydrate dehydratase [Oscillospiraceae bacterium]